MDARLLIQLSEIIDSGSMRRAAERLNVTQPTLTRNIRILEDRVGSAVLRRTPKGVEPTLIGRRLAERGQEIKEACGVAQETVNNWHKGQEREIRLGVGPMPAVTIMGPFLSWHLAQRKSFALHIQVAPPSQLVSLVDEGKIDIAIAPEQLNKQYTNLYRTILFQDELAAMVRADHPLTKLDEAGFLEALSTYEWMVVGSAGIDDGISPVLQKIGIERPAPTLVLEGAVSMALHAVQTSDLITAVPRALVRMHLKGRELIELPIPGRLPRRDVALWMQPENRDKKDFIALTKSLQAFISDAGLLPPTNSDTAV